jgi:hypothetical protein
MLVSTCSGQRGTKLAPDQQMKATRQVCSAGLVLSRQDAVVIQGWVPGPSAEP